MKGMPEAAKEKQLSQGHSHPESMASGLGMNKASIPQLWP